MKHAFRRACLALSAGVALGALAAAAEAGVTRIEIESRTPVAGSFGDAGAYELVTGRYFGEVDPKDKRNTIITDLALAPRNARGMVEYSATFALARPVDAAKASGVLFYDVPNRGNGRAVGDAGGHMHLISGWQGDIPPAPGRQTATVPIARNPDGSSVSGPVFARIVDPPAGARSVALVGGIGAGVPRPEPLSLDSSRARLVRKTSDTDAGKAVPASAWAFADCSVTTFPGKPDPHMLCLKDGFDPKFAYELSYTGKDPAVLGIGFAAVRDLVSFFHHGANAPATPNPVAGQVKWTIGVGVSQSGNFLRSFIHLGFNADEAGRIVFDGVNPQIAARQVPLNVRFAAPGGAANLYEPGSEGVLWWGAYTDKTRGLGKTSLLDRCMATKTCPKIMETFGSAEFWGLRMSPDLVGIDAKADIPLPENVRRYYFPSVTHGGGPGGFPILTMTSGGVANCTLPANPNPVSDSMRALTRSLVEWVTDGKEMPPSRYPMLAKGDLVAANSKALGYPAIPGAPKPDGKLNPVLVYDFGAGYVKADVSGVMEKTPPAIKARPPSLVPRVDADGNETTGVPSVQLRVPLGTYVGWNETSSGFYKGERMRLPGWIHPVRRDKGRAHGLRRPAPVA